VKKLKRRDILLAAGIGAVIGYLLNNNSKKLTPERALEKAKDTFQKNGPINGSWIYMKPKRLEKNGITYDTYRGGISRNIDGQNKQYDFYIDIETGAIVDAEPVVA